jgi:hypothetical protein
MTNMKVAELGIAEKTGYSNALFIKLGIAKKRDSPALITYPKMCLHDATGLY